MKLPDIISEPFLRRLQAMYASYLGTSLMITDIHGTPLITPISGVRMCSLVRNTPNGELMCEASDRNGGHETLLSKETHIYRCLAGFIDFSAAIVFHGEVIGLLVGGQVKTGSEGPDNLARVSRDTGLPLADLDSAYREMPCVQEAVLREKLEFVKKNMEFLCDITCLYYEEHLKDRKAVADANARAAMAEGIKELFDRQLNELLETVEYNPEEAKKNKALRAEIEQMLRQADTVREAAVESQEYQNCSDKNYRIREVTYELQWVLTRVKAPYGDTLVFPEITFEHVPPYLCGDPVAISEALNRILQFMTRKYPERKLQIGARGHQDGYAQLIEIRICSPGYTARDQDVIKVKQAFDSEWDTLLETRDVDLFDLSTATVVARKLSAELTCANRQEDGFYIELAVPQLPAKGGFY